MNAIIDRVRASAYQTFARTGAAPSYSTMAHGLDEPEMRIRDAVGTLAARHALVLTPDGSAIERALPFSAVPTLFRVRSDEQAWWANCIWDALAIPALLRKPGTIETTCADCAAELRVDVDPTNGPSHPDLIAHFLLPAARWYDDIRFT